MQRKGERVIRFYSNIAIRAMEKKSKSKRWRRQEVGVVTMHLDERRARRVTAKGATGRLVHILQDLPHFRMERAIGASERTNEWMKERPTLKNGSSNERTMRMTGKSTWHTYGGRKEGNKRERERERADDDDDMPARVSRTAAGQPTNQRTGWCAVTIKREWEREREWENANQRTQRDAVPSTKHR